MGKIPCRREWQPTPVLLPGESHGQRQDTVHGVTESWTQLSDQHFSHIMSPFNSNDQISQALIPPNILSTGSQPPAPVSKDLCLTGANSLVLVPLTPPLCWWPRSASPTKNIQVLPQASRHQEVEVAALSSTLCNSIIIITATLYYSLFLWLEEKGRVPVMWNLNLSSFFPHQSLFCKHVCTSAVCPPVCLSFQNSEHKWVCWTPGTQLPCRSHRAHLY